MALEKRTWQSIDKDNSTIIHFILGPPLPPAVMSNTILSAYNNITSTIASQGDSILPASKDPFLYDQGYGAFIGAHSAIGRHLTWSFLEGAVVALYNGLYLSGRYRTCGFWIRDGVMGLVGVGEMGAAGVGGGGGRNGMVRWRGVASVGIGNGNGNGNGSGNGDVTVSGVLETSEA